MKSLKQFLFESQLNLEDTLEKHLFIEFKSEQILESNGIYDNQIKIVKHIIKKIKSSSKDKTIIPSSEFDFDVFFKEIELVKDEHNTSYDSDECDYLDDEGIMDKVYITFNPDSKELTTDLVHELTHAWDDYNSYVKEAPVIPIEISTSDRYENAREAANQAKEFRKSFKTKKFDAQEYCTHAVYSLMKVEQNAFISEIHAIFVDHEDDLLSYKEALELFKNSKSYKDFKLIQSFIDNISEDDKNLFVKTYNKINDVNWTWNKIYKKINHQLTNYFSKVSKHIARAYYEMVKER